MKPKPQIDLRREVRFLTVGELRIDGDEAPTIKGYAARFDKWSEKLFGFFREKIQRGAFSKTIAESDIRGLVNHDPQFVLGRNKAGTLRLAEDEKGLAFEIDPPDTQWARDLVTSMKRGDINQASFGFQTIKDEWNEDGDERTLLEVNLFDVSVVTYPAYKQTSSVVRSLLPDCGIDLEAIRGVMFRHQRGVALTPSDKDLMQSSIDLLRSYLPAEQPQDPPAEPAQVHSAGDGKPAESHLADVRTGDVPVAASQPTPNLAHYRRRLRLAETT